MDPAITAPAPAPTTATDTTVNAPVTSPAVEAPVTTPPPPQTVDVKKFLEQNSSDFFKSAIKAAPAVTKGDAPATTPPPAQPEPGAQAPAGDAPSSATTPPVTTPGEGGTPPPVADPNAPVQESELAKLQRENAELKQRQQVASEVAAIQQMDQNDMVVEQQYQQRLNRIKALGLNKKAQMDAAAADQDVESYNALRAEFDALGVTYNELSADRSSWISTVSARKSAEDNQRHVSTLDATLAKGGLSMAELKKVKADIAPGQFYDILETALTTVTKKHEGEIATLKAELATVETKANEKYRAIWEQTRPGSQPDRAPSGAGGQAPLDFNSTSSSEYFKRAKAAK
jgi:hypothetical protein